MVCALLFISCAGPGGKCSAERREGEVMTPVTNTVRRVPAMVSTMAQKGKTVWVARVVSPAPGVAGEFYIFFRRIVH